MSSVQRVFENKDLLRLILSYIILPKYELEDWAKDIFNIKNLNTEYKEDKYQEVMNCHFESYDFLIKDYERINWKYLSSNIYAIEILEKNLDKVDWEELSSNPNAVSILEKNMDKIDWTTIAVNEKASNIIRNNIDKLNDINLLGYNEECIDLIDKYFDKIDFNNIVMNKNAVYLEKYQHFIEKNIGFINSSLYDKKSNYDNRYLKMMFFKNENLHVIFEKYEDNINWELLLKDNLFKNLMQYPPMYPFILRNYKKISFDDLSLSTCPEIIQILKENIDKINWKLLCRNPSNLVLDLIDDNIDKVDFESISSNTNNEIVKILNKYPEKIDWENLSLNNCDEAIKLLKKYPENIIYNLLYMNKNIEAMKIFYEYFIKTYIIDYKVDKWINYYLPSNPKIFIKNEIETNKCIDEFIEKI